MAEERTLLEKQQAKEIERLKRRNRTLINRIKRLTNDNDNLSEELDIIDIPRPKKRDIKMCEKCQHEMIFMDAGPVNMYLCSAMNCKHRIVIKK